MLACMFKDIPSERDGMLRENNAYREEGKGTLMLLTMIMGCKFSNTH